MYSINQDPYQLTNIANLLKNETIQHYMVSHHCFPHLITFSLVSENNGYAEKMQRGRVQ